MNKRSLFAFILIVGCSTTTTTTPPPKPSQFKNLQVFDQNIERDQLLAAMKGFTRGLGVRCEFCHVATATEPKEEFDFPADTKEEKRIARVMIRMTSQINGTWVPGVMKVAKRSEVDTVSCWTCHRGHEEPESPPPAPEPKR